MGLKAGHSVEDGFPFSADRDLRMNIVVWAGEFHQASMEDYRHEDILVDGTFVAPRPPCTCEGARHRCRNYRDAQTDDLLLVFVLLCDLERYCNPVYSTS